MKPASTLPLLLAASVAISLAGFGAISAAAPADAKPKPRRQVDSAAEPAAFGYRSDVLTLAVALADQHGLNTNWVADTLARARHVPSVVKLLQPPPAGSAKNWAAYRARFVEPGRIGAGASFWREHAKWLAQAQARWGVPPAIVVGILGVETIYGRHMGGYRVLDTLVTLAIDLPHTARHDRSALFVDELGAYLLLCKRDGLDPLALRGSFAAASGMPQFLPSSILRHAVDFDVDGRIDLHASPADVIGSVASYLHEYGWQQGTPTHYGVTPPPAGPARDSLLEADVVPTYSARWLVESGAQLDAEGMHHLGPLALIELHNGRDAPSYVAGTQNFYTITRYNRSSYYAMAVIELGSAVQAVVEATR